MDFNNTNQPPISSTPRMNEPPPPPPVSTGQPLDLSSIHGDLSLLTDESGEGIPLNDALIHSTLGSLNEEAETTRPLSRSDDTPSPHVLGAKTGSGMDVTAQLPPESDDDDDWLASGRKRGQQHVPQEPDDSLLVSAPSALKDVSRVSSDFDDFGHPNVDSSPVEVQDKYSINSSDPFDTPTKSTGQQALHKSSDEDDYEVIPAQKDSSNLLSMSSDQEDIINATILEKKSPVLRDSLSEGKKELQSTAYEEEEEDEAVGAPVAPTKVYDKVYGTSVSVSPAVDSFFSPSSTAATSQRDVSSSTTTTKSEPEPTAAPVLFSQKDLPDYSSKKGSETTTTSANKTTMEASSTTGGCPFSAGKWLSGEGLPPTVRDLVSWKDPKKSGIVFGIGLVILLSLACCSVISVVAYTALFSLAGTLAFRIYKGIMQAVQKTNEGHPFKEYLDVDITPPNEKVHQFVDVAVKHVNSVVCKLRSVFLVEDIVDSIKYFVFFYILTYVGSWFNGLTLVILTYLAFFSVPKVYEMHKTQIDQALEVACKQVQDVISMVKSKIPLPAALTKDKKQ